MLFITLLLFWSWTCLFLTSWFSFCLWHSSCCFPEVLPVLTILTADFIPPAGWIKAVCFTATVSCRDCWIGQNALCLIWMQQKILTAMNLSPLRDTSCIIRRRVYKKWPLRFPTVSPNSLFSAQTWTVRHSDSLIINLKAEKSGCAAGQSSWLNNCHGLSPDVWMEMACCDNEATLVSLIDQSIRLDILLHDQKPQRVSPQQHNKLHYNQWCWATLMSSSQRKRKAWEGLCNYCGEADHLFTQCAERLERQAKNTTKGTPRTSAV